MPEQVKPMIDWRVRLDGHAEITVKANSEIGAKLAYCEQMGIVVVGRTPQTNKRFWLGPVEG